MSEQGAGLDKAVAARCCGSGKGERWVHGRYATRQEARADVVEDIEMFYNSKRLHSYLGYTSPNASEAGARGA
jgi:transposase InsO family protein